MLEEHEWPAIVPLVDGGRDNEVLRAFYKRITGFDETSPVAIWHHRVSL